MLTRYAIFNGVVTPGLETEMREWVGVHLTPLWRQFACAERVQVLFAVEQDASGPEIPLILAITYASHEAMAKGLASPARYTSRDLLPELYQRFFEEVTLWHYVLEPDIDYATP